MLSISSWLSSLSQMFSSDWCPWNIFRMEKPSLILEDAGVWPRIRAESRTSERLVKVRSVSRAVLGRTILDPEN